MDQRGSGFCKNIKLGIFLVSTCHFFRLKFVSSAISTKGSSDLRRNVSSWEKALWHSVIFLDQMELDIFSPGLEKLLK